MAISQAFFVQGAWLGAKFGRIELKIRSWELENDNR